MSSLEAIRQQVAECKMCRLCQTRTNPVPGKGSAVSDVMFVGEAPGRNEDLHGEPFVGAAGRKLSDALEGTCMSRDDVYITNVVKCRPPNNRVPSGEEREMCSGYLKQEIDAIRPKIVCILGNTAFGSVLGGSEITKHRGKVIRKDGQLYFLTVHPAAAIYNHEMVKALDADISRLSYLITELKKGRKITIDAEHAS